MAEQILLTDDEAGIRKVLGISLADMGYDVLTAASGEEALRLFRENRPPIVLTDIKMPVMDGIELLRIIKKEHPETEVIMISGHGDMKLAIRSLKLEATDFITKPINDDVLEIALKRARERIDHRRELKRHTENLERLVREKSARLVEMERMVAVGQAVEGLSSAFSSLAVDQDSGIRYFNEMPCFVAIHSPELKIIATNPLYRQRLGDRVGAESWSIYRGAAGTRGTCPAGRTFETGTGQRSRETIAGKNGNEHPTVVHTAPIRDRNGQVALVLEITTDISEVQRLKQELEAIQRRHQHLFDAVPCYISVRDREYRLTAVNRRFEEDFGRAEGRKCYRAYKLRHLPCRDCAVQRTFRDGESHQSEKIVFTKTGRQINVLCRTAPIHNPEGEIAQVIEMATDVTEIRRLQDNLSSLGLMMGSISHGIKGVLTGLDAGVYLMESGLKRERPAQVDEGLETVKMMAERIRNVVLDILYYAKQRELKPKRIHVVRFLDELVAVVEPKVVGRGIIFKREVERSLGLFQVDTESLQSAMISILENAVEACRADEGKRRHHIFLTARKESETLVFEITDDGTGMPAKDRDRVFDLFFSQKGRRGTGLGLFIAKKIIEQHGGAIVLESTPGEGTRFVIRMPRNQPDSEETTADPDLESQPSAPRPAAPAG